VGDTLAIHGPTTCVVDLTVADLCHDEEVCSRAGKGTWITFPCEQRMRLNDKVFIVKSVKNPLFPTFLRHSERS
jgi:hypothetical protein